MPYAVLSGMDTMNIMHFALFVGGGYYLNYALRSIFEECILFIALSSPFLGEWILMILYTSQYFQGVNTFFFYALYSIFIDGYLNFKHYAVF